MRAEPISSHLSFDIMSSSGMMFIFGETDNVTSAFVSKDPAFSEVVGYQTSNSFISNNMIEHMIFELEKKYPGDDVDMYNYDSDEGLSNLMYSYCYSCLEECVGGEIPKGIFFQRILY